MNENNAAAYRGKAGDLAMFGCDPKAFLESARESITYRLSGGFMVVGGLLSDAQEQLASGNAEQSRKTINVAKHLLFKAAQGEFELFNGEIPMSGGKSEAEAVDQEIMAANEATWEVVGYQDVTAFNAVRGDLLAHGLGTYRDAFEFVGTKGYQVFKIQDSDRETINVVGPDGVALDL